MSAHIFFASAVMAMIHDAYANEKNAVTCEERSFFKQCAIDIVVRRRLNPGSSSSSSSSSSCCGNNSSSRSGSGSGSRSRSRSRSSEYE